MAERLASVYQKDGKYRAAAELLASIPLDSGQRVIDDKWRAQIYTTIAENFLLEMDWESADKALNRAAAVDKSPEITLRYKIAFANVLDFKQKFLEAARHYFQIAHQVTDSAAQLSFMQQAISACVLSEAGPQRSRLLNILYKDELAPKTQVYPFLESVYLDRVVRGEVVQRFAAMLKPHHVAKGPAGDSVLETAIVQHNLLSASRIYNNISFEQMSGLLQIPKDKAEKVAASMIMDQRLAASIDQIDGIVTFDAGRATLPLWDAQIDGTCHTVDRVILLLQRACPSMVQGL